MKKGFVLLETIVVVSVLCVTLMTLYVGYNNTTNNVKSQLNYDNTEFIYKAYILKTFLEDKIVNKGSYACENCESIYILCNEKKETTTCSEWVDKLDVNNNDKLFLKDLIDDMNIKAIYITKWDTSTFINKPELMSVFEATTGRYIRSLNPEKRDGYRIIVMFKDDQYASLGFESRIRSVG